MDIAARFADTDQSMGTRPIVRVTTTRSVGQRIRRRGGAMVTNGTLRTSRQRRGAMATIGGVTPGRRLGRLRGARAPVGVRTHGMGRRGSFRRGLFFRRGLMRRQRPLVAVLRTQPRYRSCGPLVAVLRQEMQANGKGERAGKVSDRLCHGVRTRVY